MNRPDVLARMAQARNPQKDAPKAVEKAKPEVESVQGVEAPEVQEAVQEAPEATSEATVEDTAPERPSLTLADRRRWVRSFNRVIRPTLAVAKLLYFSPPNHDCPTEKAKLLRALPPDPICVKA